MGKCTPKKGVHMLTMNQKQALCYEIKRRYQHATKKQKTEILNEFVATCGYNRSYARRVLGNPHKTGRKRKHQLRNRRYDASVFYALRSLWLAADGICGQRLKPFIPELIRVLRREREITIPRSIEHKLRTIGSATIDRMLRATKKQYQLKGKATTKPGTLLKQSIPIRTFADWDDTRPGFFEMDLVAFCGDSVKGEYINGLNMTDVATGWVCLDAVMGKGQIRVHEAIDSARHRLVFTILGLDSDNGSEFINAILKRYCTKEQITFTRIRPNHKNDNCYVEQKNYTSLRRFIGYARYESKAQLIIIKQILVLAELYINFFQPVLKLKSKQRIGSKVKKQYDEAKTPYQRLLASGILTQEQKDALQRQYERLNPLELKRKINVLTKKLDKTLRYKINDLTNT
jgi:hypothetical protein